ncbi:hypothetical protein BpHYR1_050269 [Brachionus plicatilis]|uniref:Uncharacterized protein n=1 Tax=Brachionus plicatilis TaxID=10195 RepID=A0A3M7RVL8_BRAPC|nr:hypothetical protein BpHYR1_050269 [Brachionus plicatilis]
MSISIRRKSAFWKIERDIFYCLNSGNCKKSIPGEINSPHFVANKKAIMKDNLNLKILEKSSIETNLIPPYKSNFKNCSQKTFEDDSFLPYAQLKKKGLSYFRLKFLLYKDHKLILKEYKNIAGPYIYLDY